MSTFFTKKHLPSWVFWLFIAIIIIGAIGFWFFIKKENEKPVLPPLLPVEKEEKEEIYYLGILPLDTPTTMNERFIGLARYLQRETGLNIQLRLYPTIGELGGYTAVVRDITEGKIDFAFLAPVTAVQAQGNGPVIPFVCAKKDGSPTYQGVLAVKEDSPYQTLEDLKGRRVTGTSRSSTSGNLMPSAMMLEKGIDKDTFFEGGMQFLGSHDKAAEAVLAGTMDGCFINETTYHKYKKQGLRAIWWHDPVPEFPFVVNTEKVAPEKLEKVKNALLKMHEIDLASIEAVDLKYEKWVEISWEDYLGIKKGIDAVFGEIFYDLERWGKE